MLPQLRHDGRRKGNEATRLFSLWRDDDAVLKLPCDLYASPLEVDVLEADSEEFRLSQPTGSAHFNQ